MGFRASRRAIVKDEGGRMNDEEVSKIQEKRTAALDHGRGHRRPYSLSQPRVLEFLFILQPFASRPFPGLRRHPKLREYFALPFIINRRFFSCHSDSERYSWTAGQRPGSAIT